LPWHAAAGQNAGMSTSRDYARVQLSAVQQRISQLTATLDGMPAGIDSVTVDGTTTRWSRKALLDELAHWQSRAAVLRGKRQRVATIRLNNSF